jgi:hypothetical protein
VSGEGILSLADGHLLTMPLRLRAKDLHFDKISKEIHTTKFENT